MNTKNSILTFFIFFLLSHCLTTEVTSQKKSKTKPEILVHFPDTRKINSFNDADISLEFSVKSKSQLTKVLLRVEGEKKSSSFNICGDNTNPCKGKKMTYKFKELFTAFDGMNSITISAIDLSGSTGKQSFKVKVKPNVYADDNPNQNDVVVGDPYVTPVYDLLILSHNDEVDDKDGYMIPLNRLVEHKNQTGMRTKLVILDSIYNIPAYRGIDHPEIIKKAIEYEYRFHGIKYVMLVGDADRFPVRYIKNHDLSHWGNSFSPSDLYYADLLNSHGQFDDWDYDNDQLFGETQHNFPKNYNEMNLDRIDLIPDVAVGRVPISNIQELEIYVDKVISYETNPEMNWFNKSLVIAGDYVDADNNHLWANNTSDYIAALMENDGLQVQKLYWNEIWPSTTMSQRGSLINKKIDEGVGFVSFVGHGSGVPRGAQVGGSWGGWYDVNDILSLSNEDKLPVIFSAACETGMFHYGNGPYFTKNGFDHHNDNTYRVKKFHKYLSTPEPNAFLPSNYDVDAMAEHFLVKQKVGGIAFIGSYTGAQIGTHDLAKYFFEAYTNGEQVLGDMWKIALQSFKTNIIDQFSYPGDDSWYTAATYSHVHKMLLFGDPSLRVGGLKADLIPVRDQKYGYATTENGQLVVEVKNIGYADSNYSVLEVDFGASGSKSGIVQPLMPGQSQTLVIDFPTGCFNPDCHFKIVVDVNDDVSESNESNNIGQGTIIG